ncbi:hypothetical protein A2662_02380 [Candidatus Giovannonibacteria bacterium RIFCSPHIGHO2_01_FULL_45_33]|nr:MAG: hypothetical protein A2662_02380 [Candidatus Giovannonibacteria bacterium RIFCSPHIGHO2_01_FULL_45_33]
MNNRLLTRKLTISGSVVELLEFSPVTRKNHRTFNPDELEKRKETKRLYNAGIETPDKDKTASSVARSKASVRRIVYANAWAWKDKNGYIIPPKFFTLTFKENIQDLKTANRFLSEYIQKLNYRFKPILAQPLKYVCVPEFQQRGAIHYHIVLFNFPFMDHVFKKLRDAWGGDRIHLKTIQRKSDVHDVTFYVSKYITKQAIDGRFWGQKRYFASRDIKKSVILKDDIAIEMVCQVIQPYERYKTVYNVPYCGDVRYWSYYLGEKRNIYSLPLLSYAREQIALAEKSKKS